MLVFAAYASTHIMTAGDTWTALACGRHIYYHGVSAVDPFSFNSKPAGPADEELKKYPPIITKLFSPETIRRWHPTGWINQNWLSHLFFYWLSAHSPIADAEDGRFNSLVFWKFAMYILAVFLIYGAARLLKADAVIAAASACAALFTARSLLDIRPAAFSNVFAVVFLTILLLTTYRNVLYVWLVVPLIVLWSNLHGGFIYAFYMLAAFIAIHALTVLFRGPFVSIGRRGLKHTLGAALASLVAMVVFNPFHLANLTHTFVISFSPQAATWRKVNEWHGAFEWTNPAGTGVPFLILFIALLVLLGLWLVVRGIVSERLPHVSNGQANQNSSAFPWPKIDLAVIAVAALTMAMAVKSRRFIPMAAFVACPVMAMMLDQLIKMMAVGNSWVNAKTGFIRKYPSWILPGVTACGIFACLTAWMAAANWRGIWTGHKSLLMTLWIVMGILSLGAALHQVLRIKAARGQLSALPAALPVPSRSLRRMVIVSALAVAVLCGGFWGWKFKKIYLDPAPADMEYVSVFMRMTASYIKPFGACAFLRANKISGSAFNDWTEGGFIAWGQEPDPATGRTPLQVFIDGRAQAAYDVGVFADWEAICRGGPSAAGSPPDRPAPAKMEDRSIGDWIDRQLAARGVWIVLALDAKFQAPTQLLMDALEKHPDWKPAYYDGDQRLLVRYSDLRGKKLHDDVFLGTARFPSEYSRAMTAADVLLRLDDADSVERGLQSALSAFEAKPSPEALLLAFRALGREEPKKRVEQACRDWLAKFERERPASAKKKGHETRLAAAVTAVDYVIRISPDAAEQRRWAERRGRWLAEINELGARQRW